MKRLLFLSIVTIILSSCNEKTTTTSKIIENINYFGWFDYATINFTDGTFGYRAPGWIRDLGLRQGDTISVFLEQSQWPDTLFLHPIRIEDILDSGTQEHLGFTVAFEDVSGLMIKKKNYKTAQKIPSELRYCKSNYQYYEYGKE